MEVRTSTYKFWGDGEDMLIHNTPTSNSLRPWDLLCQFSFFLNSRGQGSTVPLKIPHLTSDVQEADHAPHRSGATSHSNNTPKRSPSSLSSSYLVSANIGTEDAGQGLCPHHICLVLSSGLCPHPFRKLVLLVVCCSLIKLWSRASRMTTLWQSQISTKW